MALLAFNKTGSPLLMAAGGATLPASAAPPARGQPVNVSSELKPLASIDFDAIQVQVAAGDLELAWTHQQEFDTGSLLVYTAGVTVISWRPGATGVNAFGSNVYVGEGLAGFEEVFTASQAIAAQSTVFLEADARFSSFVSSVLVNGNPKPACFMPKPTSGKWDWRNIVLTTPQIGGAGAFEWEDGHDYNANFYNMKAWGALIAYNGTTGSPFVNNSFNAFQGAEIRNSVVGAEPFLLADAGFVFMGMNGNFVMLGELIYGTAANVAPVIGIRNGSFGIIGCLEGNVDDNAIEVDATSSCFFPMLAASMSGNWPAVPSQANYDFPAVTGNLDMRACERDRTYLSGVVTEEYDAVFNDFIEADPNNGGAGGDFNINLPAVNYSRDRICFHIIDDGGATKDTVTFVAAVGDTINGGATLSQTGAGKGGILRSNGNNAWYLVAGA